MFVRCTSEVPSFILAVSVPPCISGDQWKNGPVIVKILEYYLETFMKRVLDING